MATDSDPKRPGPDSQDPDPQGPNPMGIAIDLGSTTIAGALVELNGNLKDNSIIKKLTVLNPQREIGADILARVKAAMDDKSVLKDMTDMAVNAINDIISGLCDGSAEKEKQVEIITIAGNTVMEHILLGVDPSGLGKVPYRPAFKESQILKASEIGLNADCDVYIFPIIGGFVGGDAVSVILGEEFYEDNLNTISIDIGTNSEIILATKAGTIHGASVPAGPAFEAGEIRHGMVASPGAIEKVIIENDRLTVKTIGGKSKAKGICGSGLVEAVSVCLKAGLIDNTGRIIDSDEVDGPLARHIKKDTHSDANEADNVIVLYKGAEIEIALTQADIRALQFAKAACMAGITMLLQKTKLAPKDIDQVFIAGTFGAHLDKSHLAAIKLIDEIWLDKVKVIGDGALTGAVKALTKEGQSKADKIAADCKYLSLSGSKNFESEFIKEMGF